MGSDWDSAHSAAEKSLKEGDFLVHPHAQVWKSREDDNDATAMVIMINTMMMTAVNPSGSQGGLYLGTSSHDDYSGEHLGRPRQPGGRARQADGQATSLRHRCGDSHHHFTEISCDQCS